MIVQNPWVGYLDRTYSQVRQKCLLRLSINAPEITDYSEGNPLIVILDMFAGISEVWNFYLDKGLEDLYLLSTTVWSYCLKLAGALDYNIKISRPASTDIQVSFLDASNNPVQITSNFILNAGTQVITPNGLVFTLSNDVFIPAGSSGIQFPVEQYVLVTNEPLGVTQGITNEEVILGNNVAIGSLSLLLGTTIWTEVDTFAYSKPTDNHFIITLDEDREAIIKFGDGVFGRIPPAGLNIVADFKVTQGANANKILPGGVNAFVSTPNIPGVFNYSVSNVTTTAGGADYESFDEVKFRAPLALRTLRRFVTPKDGEDLALEYPGVYRAKVDFCCERDSKVKMYVGPNGGGVPSQQLLDNLENYLSCKMALGMPELETIHAGESFWVISLKAKAKFRQQPVLVYQDIFNALTQFGAYENSDINKALRYSDILGLVDNLPRVDFANIVTLKTLPYARPLNHFTPLNWVTDVNQTSSEPLKWKLEMSIAGMRVFKENVFMGTYPIGATYTDPDGVIVFTINPGLYSVGMSWSFITHKINTDQVIKDFSIPVISQALLYLEVDPANGDDCKPCCTC
jgi:hypothetical protein